MPIRPIEILVICFLLVGVFALAISCSSGGKDVRHEGDSEIDSEDSESSTDGDSELEMATETDTEIREDLDEQDTEQTETDLFLANPYFSCGEHMEYKAPYPMLAFVNPFPAANLPLVPAATENNLYFSRMGGGSPIEWPSIAEAVDMGNCGADCVSSRDDLPPSNETCLCFMI